MSDELTPPSDAATPNTPPAPTPAESSQSGGSVPAPSTAEPPSSPATTRTDQPSQGEATNQAGASASTAAAAPATPPKPEAPTPPEAADDSCSLDVFVRDEYGRPIPRIAVRVFKRVDNAKLPVFEGLTDASGALKSIDSMALGTSFEIQLKTDRGDYKFAAIGTLTAKECVGNLRLRQRFEFSSYSHQGSPGTAEKVKTKLTASHSQKPDGKIDVSRNSTETQKIELNRNQSGSPIAVVTSGQRNMVGQNGLTAPNPNIGLPNVDKVKKLMEFSKEQLTWVHPSNKTSQTIIAQMKASNYHYDTRAAALGYATTSGRCAKYVKVALWKAGYIDKDDDFMPTEGSASRLGPGLVDAGFHDITSLLPDARWAAPGDVIVYRRIGAPDAAGHIDIRTYDGYISDFWDSYLPTSLFEVIGIYRRYYDPMPEKRMRAFLKVIRSREATTLMTGAGDAATYRALPDPGKKGATPPTFDSFAEHPFANSSAKGSTASGGYGILYSTWKRYVPKWVPLSRSEEKFSPRVQDRIAVAIMEMHPGQGWGSAEYQTKIPTSLALVRNGEIEKAAKQLATVRQTQWTSLPGGTEARGYSMEDLRADYEKFLAEIG